MKYRILSFLVVITITLQFSYSVKSESLEKDCFPINYQKNFLKIYDFKGIISNSSTNVASYLIKLKDLNNRPPKTALILKD